MTSTDRRRQVPRTDLLLAESALGAARRTLGDQVVKGVIRTAQERVRSGELEADRLLEAVLDQLPQSASSLRHVLNATGVVLHTNLGRASLSAAAIDAIAVAAGHTDVEFDLATGARAPRGRGALRALLSRVPAAGGALVVNNGAAALALAAAVLAPGREIIVSRGELVEIGDGFRIPDLLEATGARLREVGTTNRTSLSDYAKAVGPATGFVLKIHPSNYVIKGFTADVPVGELATLGVPIVGDIGSGLLERRPDFGNEPDASSWLEAGADLVTASGDKLLGGPQAGLVLGSKEIVERLRRHPLHRALRVDKLTLAALEATLVGPPTPTASALDADVRELEDRAERLAGSLRAAGVPASAVATVGAVGGGGAPTLELPDWAIDLPADYTAPLRAGRPAVVSRLERGRCLLQLRCIPREEDGVLERAVRDASLALDEEGPRRT